LRDEGVRDQRRLEREGRDAGRKETIDTVDEFLGVRIDHFVEVTLVGFYDLAAALGQVTVCLQGPTQDSYSGAHFARGRQQLNAAQALAFVRQRRDYVHPELDFTDLDRARRQQAFLASVAYQLSSAGTLASPSRLHALVGVAAKDIVIDRGFDLLGFAEQAPRLMKGGLSFTTLPVKAFDTVNGQAVNLVDPDEIKNTVQKLLDPEDPTDDTPPDELPSATLDITNAAGHDGLAAALTKALSARGLTPGTLKTDRVLKAHTSLSYNPDASTPADALAQVLHSPDLTPRPDPSVAPGHLRLMIGADFVTPPDISSPSGTTTPDTGAAPAGVPATSLHADGIPCVK
jgi:LCP family protein required for cell wall assembly